MRGWVAISGGRILAVALLSVAACRDDSSEADGEALIEFNKAFTEQSPATFRDAPRPGAVNSTFELDPDGDTWIDAGNPGAIHGSDSTLVVSRYTMANEKRAYVRFVVDRMTTSVPVSNQALWLFVDAGTQSDAGLLRLRVASDAWDESKLSWSTGPSGDPLNGPGATTTNLPAPDTTGFPWLKFDITSVMSGNGVYSFRVSGTNTNDVVLRASGHPLGCNGFPCVDLEFTGEQNGPFATCPNVTDVGSKTLSATVNEASGFAASVRFPGFFYTHNDNPGPGTFFKVDGATGNVVATFVLPTVATAPCAGKSQTQCPTAGPGCFWNTSVAPAACHLGVADSEEIQVGPGPAAETSFVYFADIGDNSRNRPNVRIFRISETNLSATSGTTNLTTTQVQTIALTYPTGDSPNAEAFLVDPVHGRLLLIEKPCPASGTSSNGENRLYSLLAPLKFSSSLTPTSIALTHTGGAIHMPAHLEGNCSDQDVTSPGSRSTGASVSRTGTEIVVTFYGQTRYWYRPTGPSGYANIGEPLEYLDPVSCLGSVVNTKSFTDDPRREAITFSRSAANAVNDLFTTGEGSGHKIWQYRF